MSNVRPENVTLEATNRTAALAGVWSALGMLTVGAHLEQDHALSVWQSNLAWASFFFIFLLVPGIYFVVGRHTGQFSPAWIFSFEERPRYLVVVKRLLAWFLSAGAVLAIVTLVQNVALH